jgi:hypothetical protein
MFKINSTARLKMTAAKGDKTAEDKKLEAAEHEVELQEGVLRKAESNLKKKPDSELAKMTVEREKKALEKRKQHADNCRKDVEKAKKSNASLKVNAANPRATQELNDAMERLVAVFGSDYKSEKRDGLEEVYWEFHENIKRFRGGGDFVLVALQYEDRTGALYWEVEGEDMHQRSKPFKDSASLLWDLKKTAHKYTFGGSKLEGEIMRKITKI